MRIAATHPATSPECRPKPPIQDTRPAFKVESGWTRPWWAGSLEAHPHAERLRQTLARKAGGECLGEVPNTGNGDEEPVSSRALAAHMMEVGDNYVGLAKQVREASPELFEEVRVGQVTLSEAIRRLEGITRDARALERCQPRLVRRRRKGAAAYQPRADPALRETPWVWRQHRTFPDGC